MDEFKICLSLVLLLSGFCSAYFPFDWSNLQFNFNPATGSYERESCRTTELPPVPSSMCCGIDTTSSNRIIGGKPTALYQYPWMALIEYEMLGTGVKNLGCAGSLISGRYILTAAHCVSGKILLNFSTPMNVILGDYDKLHKGPDCVLINGENVCTEGELRIPIEKWLVHPKYDDNTTQNDVALIKLAQLAPYKAGIRPICLPSMDVTSLIKQEPLWLEVAGWGIMKMEKFNETDYKTLKDSAVKRHLKISVYDRQACKLLWWGMSSKQMCAGGLEGEGTCFGDSGGPVMFNNRGQYEISGIVSYYIGKGKLAAVQGVHSVFPNVYKYMDWITSFLVKEEMTYKWKF